MNEEFWKAADELLKAGKIVIDRPKGSAHPRFEQLVYPLDYGYIVGTSSMDGEGIDVWLGSLPEKRINALVATVDLLKRDSEIKLLVGTTPEEAQRILAFHNDSASMKGILIPREE